MELFKNPIIFLSVHFETIIKRFAVICQLFPCTSPASESIERQLRFSRRELWREILV